MNAKNGNGNKAAIEELTTLVFDGKFDTYHRIVRDALFDPAFDALSGMTMKQAGKQAYERCRYIHKKVGGPLAMMEDPNFLYVLSEWPSLLDVSVFSLLMVHYNLSFGTLYDHGKDRADLKEYFDELNELKSFSPYMATELGYGNNVAMLGTEAIYNHEDRSFTLRTPDDLSFKHMSYSGFSDESKVAIVLAKLIIEKENKGIFPFLVRITDLNGYVDGVDATPCPEKPVQGLDNGLTGFRDLKIPLKNLLYGNIGKISEDGEFTASIKSPRKRFLRAMSRIIPGRLCVSSSAVGAGKASVYLAIKYGLARKTNGSGSNDVPVLDYVNHQVDLFTALSKVYASVFLVNHSKNEYAKASEDSVEINNLIGMTKAISTWEMTEVIQVCRERCGNQGIFSVNRIADYVSLLQGLVTAEGDNQVLLGNVAGQAISKPSPELDGCEPRSPGDIGDLSYHIELFELIERSLLKKANEVASDTDKASFFDAINSALPFGLDMLKVRAVKISLKEYSAAIESVQSTDLKEGLSALAGIYGLSKLKQYSTWLLANENMLPRNLLSVDEKIHRLCSVVRQHVPLLIEGFQLSPELLRAPIAQDSYVSAFKAAAKSAKETM